MATRAKDLGLVEARRVKSDKVIQRPQELTQAAQQPHESKNAPGLPIEHKKQEIKLTKLIN